jgi:hypothetical protein
MYGVVTKALNVYQSLPARFPFVCVFYVAGLDSVDKPGSVSSSKSNTKNQASSNSTNISSVMITKRKGEKSKIKSDASTTT